MHFCFPLSLLKTTRSDSGKQPLHLSLTIFSGEAHQRHLCRLRHLDRGVARRPGLLRPVHLHLQSHVVRLSVHSGKIIFSFVSPIRWVRSVLEEETLF